MARLTIIAGLPGSGKSTYLQNHQFDAMYDDYFAFQIQQGPEKGLDINKNPLENKRYEQILSDLRADKSIAVADIVFCIAEHRNRFLAAILAHVPEVQLDFVFFENNLAACTKNIQIRNRQDRLYKELDLAKEIGDRYSAVHLIKEKVYDPQRT